MKIKYAGNTNVGMKRGHNEDSLYLMPAMNLYLVADGMGGHSSGEVASQMSVETVAQFFQETAEDDEITWPYKLDKDREYQENRLITSVKLANRRIFDSSQEQPRLKGMGTTLVCVYFANGGSYFAHVGDSRVYRIRGNTITQLTEDHSLLNDYIKMKELTPEEIENFPHKNVIVRALGMKETVQVDTGFEIPEHGDIYLLCSDGLTGMVDDDTLLRLVIEAGEDLELACNKVIDEANANGGTDNITVVLSQVLND